jgi:hypothetical protein
MSEVRILAFDPSLKCIGWAALTMDGNLLNYGQITTTEKEGGGHFARMLDLAGDCAKVTGWTRPTLVFCERPMMTSDPDAHFKLSALVGQIALVVAQTTLKLYGNAIEMTAWMPSEWRAIVKLKPDVLKLAGKLTPKGRQKCKFDYKSPALRMVAERFKTAGEALNGDSAEAILIGLAAVTELQEIPF